MWRKVICFFDSDSQMRNAFLWGLGWRLIAEGFSRQQQEAPL
jgi:hypothetical protein